MEPREEKHDGIAYTFREHVINNKMMNSILRYIEHGIRPGDFLQAVIRNDLANAVGYADEHNLANLPAYVGYFYNEAPSLCWGSQDHMDQWIDKKWNKRQSTQKEEVS